MMRRVHLVGIGGAGLSAIARVLFEQGDVVTGSDQAVSTYSQGLEQVGVLVNYGHRAENISDADVVVASSAIPDDNVELEAARGRGIPVVRRAAFLGELTAPFRTIAVAGTHGKTTTSGLIAWILDRAGLLPSFIVGGILPDLKTNARAGSGDHFVIEADEYDRTFLGLHPWIAVVTNVEHDHPDCFPTAESFQEAFEEFVRQVDELLIVCADDPIASSLSPPGVRRVTYGFAEDAMWRAEDVRPNKVGGSDFLVIERGETLGLVRTRIPGMHNVVNVLAALAVADHLGVDFKSIRDALTGFRGVERRFEILGEVAGVTVIDDYAHHPTEIKATLQAARQRFPDATIWAVFQPHTFSRTRTLLDAFADAFVDADHVIVTDIFASREASDPSISGRLVASRIKHEHACYIGDLEKVASELTGRVASESVVVTLSAGDGNLVGKLLLQGLAGKEGERRHG